MECSINNLALSLLLKHLVIGQRLKIPNFSAFHWSPRGSLASIGQLLQPCTARTAWSDSDQAVRAVHGCNSWLALRVVP